MVMEGNLVVPKTRGICEMLNGRYPFLQFETLRGEKIYSSKPSVQMLGLPKQGGGASRSWLLRLRGLRNSSPRSLFAVRAHIALVPKLYLTTSR